MKPIPHPNPVAAALAGDDDALDDVLRDWLPTVHRWCASLGAGRIDTEEAAHDVMLVFVRRRTSIDHPRQVPAFLFSTCQRVVANQRRLAWFRRWLPGAAVPEGVASERTDAPLEQRELTRQVATVLDAMSEAHRAVLALCYLEERTITEASALLGVPEGTVKSRLFHARERFRRAFERLEGR